MREWRRWNGEIGKEVEMREEEGCRRRIRDWGDEDRHLRPEELQNFNSFR